MEIPLRISAGNGDGMGSANASHLCSRSMFDVLVDLQHLLFRFLLVFQAIQEEIDIRSKTSDMCMRKTHEGKASRCKYCRRLLELGSLMPDFMTLSGSL